MSLLDYWRQLVGTAPSGYEVFEYLFVGVAAIILLQSIYALLGGLFRVFRGH